MDLMLLSLSIKVFDFEFSLTLSCYEYTKEEDELVRNWGFDVLSSAQGHLRSTELRQIHSSLGFPFHCSLFVAS